MKTTAYRLDGGDLNQDAQSYDGENLMGQCHDGRTTIIKTQWLDGDVANDTDVH